jgi:phage tail sheath protein FI
MATTYVNVPGVQIQEVRLGAPPISGVGTSTAGFVGVAPLRDRFKGVARQITTADQFRLDYILDSGGASATTSTSLSRAVLGFFANGGTECYVVNLDDFDEDSATPPPGEVQRVKEALALLSTIDTIAMIAAPGYTAQDVYGALQQEASSTGDRFAILDPPPKVDDLTTLTGAGTNRPPTGKGISMYSAFYYPRITVGADLSGDPDREDVTPVGHIAGVYARVDAARGVHKAPGNEVMLGALGVEHALTDAQQNTLNPEGVNVLRVLTGSTIVWGARTLQLDDAEYRYVNVRRLVNYIEESLQEGLRWAVFEPNTPTLQKQIARSVRGFLDRVWRDGGLFGESADQAYYVAFPPLFNTDEARAEGKLTMEVGLRVTFPAEFIVIRIGVMLQAPGA